MIKGERVILRAVEERDLPLIARWRNDPEIARFFFSPFPINAGGQKKWYEDLLADGRRIVFMIDSLEGQAVGMLGLDNIDYRNQQAELGLVVLDPGQRERRYAREAVILTIRYAFEELNLHRLVAAMYAFNRRIIEGAQWHGFQEEAVLRQAAFSGGRFHDKVIMGLLREEWQARRGLEQGERPRDGAVSKGGL